jgi:hypothetical protein
MLKEGLFYGEPYHPTGEKVSCRDPRQLRPIRRAPRRQAQPPWAHGDRVLQTPCATATGRLSVKTALK